MRPLGLGLVLALITAAPALAQPVDLPIPAAQSNEFPDGIAVSKADGGKVYTDRQGRVLYGLDMRTVRRWAPDPAMYCKDRCADWDPVRAPGAMAANIAFPKGFGSQGRKAHAKLVAEKGYHPNPQEAPDWTVIEGSFGPQWVYKGWHLVFVRKGSEARSTAFDGAEEFTWNTLKYVPPVPDVEAPGTVQPIFRDGRYVLADGEGHLLFTGRCRKNCSGWKPMTGGFASRGIGNWSIDRSRDTAQWSYRGAPVYIADSGETADLPERAKPLRPEG